MTVAWPTVSLGEVIRLDLNREPINPGKTYPMVGVLSFARGLFDREPIENGNTSYKHFLRLRADHIVMSQLFGWEGALALSDERFAGKYLSPQFPTFLTDRTRLDRRFLGWIMRRPTFWSDLGSRASGMGDRRRTLNPDALFDCKISLPPLDEQRRIVARIEQLAATIEEAKEMRAAASASLAAFVNAVGARLFEGHATSLVGDYVRFQTGYAFKSEWFVPSGVRVARNVNISHGHLNWADTARVPEEYRSQFARFELKAGDILVSLDRPLISTGVKVARVDECDLPCLLLQRVARAIFVSDSLDADYFFAWLRSPAFARAIDPGRSNGIPHISHKDIELIPFSPPRFNEQRRVVAGLDALQAKVNAVKALQSETAAELDALLPSILDKAFKGEL